MSDRKNPGGFYYIEIKPAANYKTFRALAEANETSGIKRVLGQRADGSWETVKWMVVKDSAHVENGRLVADSENVRELFKHFDSPPKLVEDNRFEAKERAAEWVN